MLKPQLIEFMRRIDKNSVAIIPAAREAVRSHDTNYRYRQNSDFFYLTGFEEPDAIAVIAPSKDKKLTLFVRPRDLEQEIWNGYRAGVEGAVADYSADEAFSINEFDEKLGEILDGPSVLYYAFGHSTPEMDQKIIRQLTSMRESNRKPLEPPATIVDPTSILHEMRVLKSAEEVEIMQRAADIAAEAHVEAMKSVRPGMMEYEVEAMLELGLLKGDTKKLIEEKKYMQFYMHNLGHYLGIDVHDAGRYYFKGESRPAEAGMVMTIEPGLYISPDTSRIPEGFNKDIPKKYLGIGVRIEDDVLVTEKGARVLTHKVPKDPEEIEAVMAN